MKAPLLSSGPHVHSMFNVPRTMVAVMACLAPATGFGLWQFGWPAVLLFGVAVLSAWIFEVACLALAGGPVAPFARDGSALLTGWLVAMTLPPWAPWWVGVAGSGAAIVIAKHAFGGLGKNLFNPAMVARAVLLIALPVQMTAWVPAMGWQAGPDFGQALAITFGGGAEIDAVSSASTLGALKSGLDAGTPMAEILAGLDAPSERFWGLTAGSLGETSAALLTLGGLGLIAMRIITPVAPLSVLGTLFGLAALAHLLDPGRHPPPLLHLTSGATMLCAFFIATDYVTSPVTALGKAVYGAGIGALVFVIRSWGSFPEGVAFAVLLMNACAPLIERATRPRIFGRTRAGKPLRPGAGR